jgi:hypothetical protein
MSDLKKFDVRYVYNGLIVVAVAVLAAGLTAKNTPVIIMAFGLGGIGFGAWLHHSPTTHIHPTYRYTTIDYEPTILGWVVVACSVCVLLFGGWRLISLP